MPQRVMIIWSCSLCNTETDSNDKVTQFQISGGGRNLGYDICTTCLHSEPFAGILAAGLSESSKGRTAPSMEEGKTRCQYCDKSYSAQGMSFHMAKAHNVKSASRIEVEARGKSGDHICKQCGFRSRGAQGLGAHMRAKHGEVGTSKTAVGERAKKAEK